MPLIQRNIGKSEQSNRLEGLEERPFLAAEPPISGQSKPLHEADKNSGTPHILYERHYREGLMSAEVEVLKALKSHTRPCKWRKLPFGH